MKARVIFARVACASVVAVAGCGGGTPGIPATGGAKSPFVPVTFHLSVPVSTGAKTNALRHANFVASATGGVLVQAFAQSDSTRSTVLGQSATDVTSGSAACGGQTGSPRTCTFTVNAPAGADTLVITSYDGPPVSGSFSGKNQLAAAAVNQTIASSSANTVNVTLGGLVKSLQVVPSSPTMHGTIAAAQPVYVNAYDADGNLIVSDNFVDVNGNALSVALQVAPNTGNVFSLASTSLGAPSATGVQLSYTGSATSTFATTITATSGPYTANANVQLQGPAFAEYATTTAGAGVTGLGLAAFGGQSTSVFFIEPNVPNLGAVTAAGGITETSLGSLGGATQIVSGPTSGPGSYDLFLTGSTTNNIEWYDLTGVSQGSDSMTTASSGPFGIAYGPDAKMWITESSASKIAVYNRNANTVTEYPTLTASANPQYITVGSDGRLWFTEKNANNIGAITTAGVVTEYAVPTAASQPFGITAGADGNLWFTEAAGNKIGVVTTSGVVTEFSIPTAASSPAQITPGPDGNLWFLETGANKLARITIGTHAFSEYVVPTTSSLSGIIAGPDGNIWFGENSASKIAKFVW